jgi:hypothetical protein
LAICLPYENRTERLARKTGTRFDDEIDPELLAKLIREDREKH